MAELQEDVGKTSPQAGIPPQNRALESDGSEYILRKNSNFRISVSKIKDEVSGGYKVNFNSPLPQFDTTFGKAYDVVKPQGEVALYAIILDKKHPIRLAEINKLIGRRIPSFASVVAAQVIPTSIARGRSFVVIIEKPAGITVAEYITRNGPLNENYLSTNFVRVLNDVILTLSQMGIVHGRINAGNVYIDDNAQIVVGECVSEPCGCSQPALYETTGRALALPIAKGNGISAIDYYALGVLVAVTIRGRDVSEGLQVNDIVNKKLEDGTYSFLTEKIEIPPRMLDLLRGALNERKLDSWNATQVTEWIKGRRFNLLPPADGADGSRSIVFNGKKYFSLKHLAHGLYTNWEEGKRFVKTDTIIKWVSKNSQEEALAEKLEIISSRFGREKETSLHKDDEVLSQYILVLDPTGPVRLRDFSANIDGLGAILADGMANNNRLYIEAVENIISHGLLSIISGNDVVAMSNSSHEAILNIQKCAELVRKRDLGFDVERCLYELNPTLPCQSPPLVDELVFNTEELLLCLDKNESIGGKILDKHTGAFLSERLELTVKIYISSLGRFPEFSNNVYIQILALLSLAQQTCGAGELPKLSMKLYEGIKVVINEFHSKTIREELTESVSKAAKKGILPNMLRILSDSKYLVRDRLGFKKSLSAYRSNAIQILRLSNARAVNNIGYRYGLQLSVMISFFVAIVEIIVLLIKTF